LAIGSFLPFQGCQVLIEEPILYRHEFLIPSVVARFVAPNQQDRAAPRVEGEEHSIGSAGMLDAQLLHVRVPRRAHRIRLRPAKIWTVPLDQLHPRGHAVLLVFGQTVPPLLELIREFDFIFH
jgi:hypothetical protein